MDEPNEKLQFLAQPQSTFRARYESENPQRFLQAETNDDDYKHPTLKIPPAWGQTQGKRLYIRLTPVTVRNTLVHHHCIHPYRLISEDPNVLADPTTNSLYYPISNDEFNVGRKTFLISLYKSTKEQLKAHGFLKLVDSPNTNDTQSLRDPTDSKQMMEVYQLSQLQLLFSMAEFSEEHKNFIVITRSNVFSQVMTDASKLKKGNILDGICAPQSGSWHGGDEVIMFVSNLDKRRGPTVRFQFELLGLTETIKPDFIDQKTLHFITPRYPIAATENQLEVSVPIVVTQAANEIARFDFLYQAGIRCQSCGNVVELARHPTLSSEELLSGDTDDNDRLEWDSSSSSTETMNTKDVPVQSFASSTTNESQQNVVCTIPKQENQWRENSLQALQLDNHSFECFLKAQPHFAQQTDQHGNNFLHLLMNLPDGQIAMKLQIICQVLPLPTKRSLLMMRNHQNRTPLETAQLYGRNHYATLLQNQISMC